MKHYETYLEMLQKKTEAARAENDGMCGDIKPNQKKSSSFFYKRNQKGLEDLNFLDVQLEMRFSSEAKMSASGMDDAEFFISVNPGEPPKPLGTTVSGGELSRDSSCDQDGTGR